MVIQTRSDPYQSTSHTNHNNLPLELLLYFLCLRYLSDYQFTRMANSYHDPATARLLMQEDEPYAFHSNDDKEKHPQEVSITDASHITTRLTIALVLACIASSILLAFAVTVALRDMRMITSIERAVDNYLDTTNRTYGFATPPPTSIDVEGAPKRATVPENATFIFPRSIDLVNTQHADEIYTGNRNVIITHYVCYCRPFN
jgi:hypothetical protein